MLDNRVSEEWLLSDPVTEAGAEVLDESIEDIAEGEDIESERNAEEGDQSGLNQFDS
jgi:hypothetical protein